MAEDNDKKPEQDGTDDDAVNNGDAVSPFKKEKGSDTKKETSRRRRSRSCSPDRRSSAKRSR